jgi:hypothetical protein
MSPVCDDGYSRVSPGISWMTLRAMMPITPWGLPNATISLCKTSFACGYFAFLCWRIDGGSACCCCRVLHCLTYGTLCLGRPVNGQIGSFVLSESVVAECLLFHGFQKLASERTHMMYFDDLPMRFVRLFYTVDILPNAQYEISWPTYIWTWYN